jgi:hypothetical protein
VCANTRRAFTRRHLLTGSHRRSSGPPRSPIILWSLSRRTQNKRCSVNQQAIGGDRAVIMREPVGIFNPDTCHKPVEPVYQSPYNARARNEDETRVANGKGSSARYP